MSDATVQVDPRPAAPSVAQLLLHYLQLEQATTLFGVPGAAVMHLLNELRTQRNTFRYIVARHETGAAYMADGYARVSGRPGVVLVTSGPGATNALTGSMNAQAGGVPLLTLTGEVPEAYFGKGYLQEGADAGLNVDTIYGNATGYSAIATNPANFQTLFEQALRDALGRPARAAHLSLPDDVAAASLPDARWPSAPRQYRSVATGVDGAGLEAAFQALTQARRPLVYVGSGCREALRGGGLARFTALVEKFALPVVCTPDAKGLFPESHPLSLRCFGVAFSEWVRLYLQPQLLDPSATPGFDMLLVLGTQLGGFATAKYSPLLQPTGTLVQVDLNPDVIGRTMALGFGVVAELGGAIDALASMGDAAKPDDAAVAERRGAVAALKRQVSPYLAPDQRDATRSPVAPAAAMKCLGQVLPPGSEIFIDAGNCVGWALHYLDIDPPTRVHSALAMGPMGFAVAAVVGAKIAAPERACLAIVGDGAMLMHGTELSTAAANRVGAVWLVLDNQDLGMVSQGMAQFFPTAGDWTDYYSLGSTDLVAFAQSLGADAQAADTLDGLRQALAQALDAAQTRQRPQVVVLRIDKSAVPPYYQDPSAPLPAGQNPRSAA